MKKRTVFIGGKQIGVNCLRVLLSRDLPPDLVIANTDDTGKDTWHESLVRIAKENNLPLVQARHVKEPEVVKKIEKINPEVIFCIGVTQLIPGHVLKIPKLGCLNIHPAMLPKYRGRYSTVHAIFNGEKETGVTMHWMDSEIDSGPIIKQRRIPIKDTDTAKTLYDEFTSVGKKLFITFLDEWLKGAKIQSLAQDNKKATYYTKELPNNGEIDWRWNGKQIRNFIRAMTFEPFSPAKFTIGKKKMVIVDEKYFKGF